MRLLFSSRFHSGFKFSISLTALSLLILQPCAVFAASSSMPSGSAKPKLTPEQQAIQVLSRLSFGTRATDLDAIKKSGIQAYVEQQLSPGTIDDSALDKRLEKLPTLMLANPTLAEQYNPPKPTPTPSPAAPKAGILVH